jgi:hypothetical protein
VPPSKLPLKIRESMVSRTRLRPIHRNEGPLSFRVVRWLPAKSGAGGNRRCSVGRRLTTLEGGNRGVRQRRIGSGRGYGDLKEAFCAEVAERGWRHELGRSRRALRQRVIPGVVLQAWVRRRVSSAGSKGRRNRCAPVVSKGVSPRQTGRVAHDRPIHSGGARGRGVPAKLSTITIAAPHSGQIKGDAVVSTASPV